MAAVRAAAIVVLLAFAAAAGDAKAQTVSLNGRIGDRAALLVIDGQPRTLVVGQSERGVRLLSLAADEAAVEVGAKRLVLRVGAAPVSLGSGGAAAAADGNVIVLAAGPGGHFVTGGQINGRAVRFMVDTGATTVAMSQADADRIGLDWHAGSRVLAHTAGGTVTASAVVLSSVRVGDVEVANVQAVVLPAAMPQVLLGNSFLTRFQMKRDNDTLRLEKRP